MKNNVITNKDEAKNLIIRVFKEISSANSSDKILAFRKEVEFEVGICFYEEKYPRLNFTLSPDEIKNITLDNYEVNLVNPFAKLLYAMAWKQGDLPKLVHIIKGIEDFDKTVDYDKAQVFYQFGKHLAQPESEPIVDQHVLRAFSLYNYVNNNLKPQKEKQIIEDYKAWINQLNLHIADRAEYLYQIDKLLFVVGKAIKPVNF